MLDLLKRPSAFVPLVISAGFLIPMLYGIAQGTLVRRPDEDAGAHLFQILMPVQLAIIGFFAISWLPRRAKDALPVLVLQCAAAGAVVAIVFFRHL
jgi:hypothetical protein